jgi:fibronectin type III domain protein
MKINTNLSCLIVQSNLKTSTNGLNIAIERMTTGFKINHAKDNAANYSINTNLSSQLSSYEVAQDNVSMGLDMVMTAMDSLELISSHLSRMRDLAELAANGTSGESSLQAIQSEINVRSDEINRLVTNTEFNNLNLFEGEPEEMGDFIARVDRLTEEEAIAQGYTIITTADELQAMQDNLSGKYILMNNIDLEGYDWTSVGTTANPFLGEFNGNGYVISNLKIIKPDENDLGVFGYTGTSSISNLGLENIEINGKDHCGSLVGQGGGTVKNCYSTNAVISGRHIIGGLIGWDFTNSISFCYSNSDVSGNGYVGALLGESYNSVDNCFAVGSVTSPWLAGGLIGKCYSKISNSYAAAKVSCNNDGGGLVGSAGQDLGNCYWDIDESSQVTSACGTGVTTDELEALIETGILPSILEPENKYYPTVFQAGIDSSSSSKISLNISFALTVPKIDLSTSESARNSLEKIDELIKRVNAKQTEYGAAHNRLESALESIGVSIDNLTSTQSTIRDADIAEESSAYIRNQILQQAAMTLMATANQTPELALQLL